MKLSFPLTILVFILTIAACSTSKVTSRWKKDDVTNVKFDKIIVLCMTNDKDRELQQEMENHLSEDLRNLGYNAHSALQVYGPKVFDNMNEQQVNDKLKNDSVGAVMTIVLLDKQKERYYAPGRIIYTPYAYYHRDFWGYYSSIHYRIGMPGYYGYFNMPQTSTQYFWESNLYDLKSNQLVYSVQTRSFDPFSARSLAHEYGRIIVDDMTKYGLISKQNSIATTN